MNSSRNTARNTSSNTTSASLATSKSSKQLQQQSSDKSKNAEKDEKHVDPEQQKQQAKSSSTKKTKSNKKKHQQQPEEKKERTMHELDASGTESEKEHSPGNAASASADSNIASTPVVPAIILAPPTPSVKIFNQPYMKHRAAVDSTASISSDPNKWPYKHCYEEVRSLPQPMAQNEAGSVSSASTSQSQQQAQASVIVTLVTTPRRRQMMRVSGAVTVRQLYQHAKFLSGIHDAPFDLLFSYPHRILSPPDATLADLGFESLSLLQRLYSDRPPPSRLVGQSAHTAGDHNQHSGNSSSHGSPAKQIKVKRQPSLGVQHLSSNNGGNGAPSPRSQPRTTSHSER